MGNFYKPRSVIPLIRFGRALWFRKNISPYNIAGFKSRGISRNAKNINIACILKMFHARSPPGRSIPYLQCVHIGTPGNIRFVWRKTREDRPRNTRYSYNFTREWTLWNTQRWDALERLIMVNRTNSPCHHFVCFFSCFISTLLSCVVLLKCGAKKQFCRHDQCK